MTVRAKFKVDSIARSKGWGDIKEVQTIHLTPVMSGSEENEAFYAATPAGEINLGIVNADAAKQFDLGAEFYVDFTPADSVSGFSKGDIVKLVGDLEELGIDTSDWTPEDYYAIIAYTYADGVTMLAKNRWTDHGWAVTEENLEKVE